MQEMIEWQKNYKATLLAQKNSEDEESKNINVKKHGLLNPEYSGMGQIGESSSFKKPSPPEEKNEVMST